MSSSASPTVPRSVAAVSGALSLFGLVGLLLTLTFGFETPNTALLALSAPLVFAAPMAALWHLVTARTLTPADKHIWTRELTNAEVFAALAEYLKSTDLRASAQKLTADSAASRASKNRT